MPKNNDGIGTTSPSYKLNVVNSVAATTGVQDIAGFTVSSTGSTDGTFGTRLLLFTENPNGNMWPAGIAAINDAGGSNLSALGFYTATSGPTLNERMRLSSSGSLSLTQSAGAYSLDTTSSSASYANGATVDFPSFSGMILANDQLSTGYVTIWLVGFGNATAAASHGGTPVGSMAYNAGVAGYRWTNDSGATRTVAFMAFRTRNTA